jgi:RNA polymerase sigma-70 factor (ECF subfamily)
MGFDSALPDSLASGLGASSQDEARLRRAFVQHYPGVWRFLRRLGVARDRVDDAAQHVFLIMLEAIPRIVPGCERAFLYATAIRVAHGVRRRPQREIATLEVDRESSLPSPDELTDQKRAREMLDRLLECIDLDTRAVFVLFEIEGFTVPEIADLLKVPLGTAASRLRRSREQFRALVEECSRPPVPAPPAPPPSSRRP